MGRSVGVALVLGSLVHSLPSWAAPGAVVPDADAHAGAASAGDVAAQTELTPSALKKAVGDELAKRHLLLAMRDLRMSFRRDESGTWFLSVENTKDGCQASEPVGSFDVLSQARVEALASSVRTLVERSRCGVLSAETPPVVLKAEPHVAAWVRPAGGAYAAASAFAFTAFWLSDDPLLPAGFASAPSATLFSGLGLGFAGGMSTLFVPERVARPMLELSVGSSLALTALAFAQVPEAGVPAYGDYAAASGYALTTALVGVNFALSSQDATLRAPLWATEQDVPSPALSPWLVYSPAVLGAMVSMSRAFDPEMDAGDREVAVGLGLGALAPATAGLVMGVIGSKRRAERERPEAWIASGPRGSFGLTVGGSF